jgi:hypothetical protein
LSHLVSFFLFEKETPKREKNREALSLVIITYRNILFYMMILHLYLLLVPRRGKLFFFSFSFFYKKRKRKPVKGGK